MSQVKERLRVRVIDAETQEFNGIIYNLYGKYFQTSDGGRKRLHRAVWEYYNGEIPEGYHIHHIDHDRLNNDIENLSCLTASEHLAYHAELQTEERIKEFVRIGQEAARIWHGSPEGIEWHRKQYELTKHKLHKKDVITCVQCSKEVVAAARETESGNRYCSEKCKAAWRRDTGVDDEPRACQHCKQDFVCNKYQKTKYCSSDCKKSAMREAREKAKA